MDGSGQEGGSKGWEIARGQAKGLRDGRVRKGKIDGW
jgi:hypothetical protein